MKRILPVIFLLLTVFAYAENKHPKPLKTEHFQNIENDTVTKIMIRARAKDAKFIGTSIGGGKVIVRDAETGEILDQGMLAGSTGNTRVLMKTPKKRFMPLADKNTAGFLAKLNLIKPTLISIEILAPLNQRQSRLAVSTQQWVFPGTDILGDGIILKVPGFIVDMTKPGPHTSFSSDEMIPVSANVMMMCGCPIRPDGLWDANDYKVSVAVYQKGSKIKEVPLNWKSTSFFAGKLNLPSGLYELNLKVFDSKTGNTGLDKTNIIVK